MLQLCRACLGKWKMAVHNSLVGKHTGTKNPKPSILLLLLSNPLHSSYLSQSGFTNFRHNLSFTQGQRVSSWLFAITKRSYQTSSKSHNPTKTQSLTAVTTKFSSLTGTFLGKTIYQASQATLQQKRTLYNPTLLVVNKQALKPKLRYHEIFKGHFLYNIKLLCKLPNT